MSSFIRRIERTQHESKKCHSFEVKDPTTGLPTSIGQYRPRCGLHDAASGEVVWYSNPPRHVHYKHRGSKLGFSNPQAKDLVMRQNRERQRSLRRMIALDEQMGLI